MTVVLINGCGTGSGPEAALVRSRHAEMAQRRRATVAVTRPAAGSAALIQSAGR
jgi:hypothetical protein